MYRAATSRSFWPGAATVTMVALAVLLVFVLRDGFGWGDVVGALAVGLGVLIALLVVRRFASR